MLWVTHLALALLLSRALSLGPGPTLLVMIGSLLPDLDCQRAFISGRIPFSEAFEIALGHRGLLHSALLAVLVPEWHVCAGWLSHIALDAMTRTGVRPLYPLSGKRFRWIVRAGGLAEMALGLAIIGTAAIG